MLREVRIDLGPPLSIHTLVFFAYALAVRMVSATDGILIGGSGGSWRKRI
jgi:hypothetical protein